MQGMLTFILVFGVIVTVHEFGHFYFAKRSGILVREFAIGMGPKIFSHIGKDGTTYTIRILPIGGYVRMAGWGDDNTEIKTGTPVMLSIDPSGIVTKINLSTKVLDSTALPMNVISYDLEDKLILTGLVLEETKTYSVSREATVIEGDGTEIRIAPLDVQYQNASIFGKLMTNFAGPMNNFILGIVVFVALVFLQGGSIDYKTNIVRVNPGGALAKSGAETGYKVLEIDGIAISNWTELHEAVDASTADMAEGEKLQVVVEDKDGNKKTLDVIPEKMEGSFFIGVLPGVKTGILDKVIGGFVMAWEAAFSILSALKRLVMSFSLDQLGGPVAMYQMSNQVASNGVLSVLSFMGFISINVGIFNLIPIPALDGGKIVLNILEAIRRKPIKQETETYVTLAGVVFMVVLMVAVTWNDIMRVFF